MGNSDRAVGGWEYPGRVVKVGRRRLREGFSVNVCKPEGMCALSYILAGGMDCIPMV